MQVSSTDFFHNVTVRICSSLHLEVSMSRTVEYMRTLMPIDEMYLSLYDVATGTHRIIARSGGAEGVLLDQRRGDIPEAVRESIERFDRRPDKSALIIADPRREPALSFLYPFVECERYSCMLMPLSVESHLLGVVLLFAAGRDRYVPAHAALLSGVVQPFTIALANTLEHLELIRFKRQLEEENKTLRQKLHDGFSGEVVGRDGGLKGVFELVDLVAPLMNPVLLLGETGTGKEVIAHCIHQASSRKGPFVAVNCGAIPPTLVDSELFGHEKGAFTGAAAVKRGFFERAQNGTIFLDEIGELPLEVQVRLLRVIQEKEITRVGGEKSLPLNVRIVCATNSDLEQMAKTQKFRQDLLFRINVFPVRIPPLRQRREDIPSLVECFIRIKAAEMGLRENPVVGTGELEQLLAYDWPGNVRELQNVIERAVILRKDNRLSLAPLLSAGERRPEPPAGPEGLDHCIAQHIAEALSQTRGRISGPHGAAKRLGLNPSTLRNKMKKLGITVCGQ